MSQFDLFQVSEIRYTKTDQEPTQRSIIPTFVPDLNMKAVDVTALTEDQRSVVSGLLKDYADYVNDATKRVFSFDDWLDHTQNADKIEGKIQWRTFNLSKTEQV